MTQSKKRRKRFLKLLFVGMCVLLLLEVSARLFCWYRYDVSPLHPDELLWVMYPGLQAVDGVQITKSDGQFDIALIGASVLQQVYHSKKLQATLADRYGGQTRLFGFTHGGMTSLDSLFQLQLLEDKPFDLIVLCQSINELRLNNCPDDVFRADYSHLDRLRIYRQRVEGGSFNFALPILREGIRKALVKEPWSESVSSENLAMAAHGARIKTGPSLEANLRAIIRLARERETRVILMTFPYYLPPDYTREKYEAARLDYDEETFAPVEYWGLPSNIVKGLEAHNEVIRRVGTEEGVVFIDQAARIPQRGDLFRDICHYSEAGTERFVANLLPAIYEAVERAGIRPLQRADAP